MDPTHIFAPKWLSFPARASRGGGGVPPPAQHVAQPDNVQRESAEREKVQRGNIYGENRLIERDTATVTVRPMRRKGGDSASSVPGSEKEVCVSFESKYRVFFLLFSCLYCVLAYRVGGQEPRVHQQRTLFEQNFVCEPDQFFLFFPTIYHWIHIPTPPLPAALTLCH